MFTGSHSAVGASIFLILPNEIGFVLAFLSHDALDLISEKWPAGNKYLKAGIVELVSMIVITAIGLYTHKLLIIMIGAVAGNIIDLIDKPRYFSGRKEFFGCHQPGYTKVGLSSYAQTMALQALLIFILFLIAI